ncbi:MAG: SDR family oxidoreductase [Lachnospiraceae bacterium]|nr:SDR family oxidoreductase [Lachnospiraceae bacterium]
MIWINKVYIVIGGGSGIGAATVHRLKDKNATVYVFDLKYDYEINDNCFICDVRDDERITELISNIYSCEGRIDGVFHIAGIHIIGDVLTNTNQQINEIFDINVQGCINTLRAVLPIMKKQGYGSIILPGSDQCIIAKTDSCYYGMTKMAISYLTKSVALDFAKYHIRVNAICPGPVNTNMYQKSVDYIQQNYPKYNDRDYLWKVLEQRQPMGKIADADDIAGLVCFLLSDDSTYMTGALIPIDGGTTVGTL